MGIREQIGAAALPLAKNVMVRDVRIGLGYTAALLDGGRCGLSYTFRDQGFSGCTVFNHMRPLAGRAAGDLLELLSSKDLISSAVAVATANALLNTETCNPSTGDILDFIELRHTDTVAMVGHFAPLTARIRSRVASLSIFEEKATAAGRDLLPADTVHGFLPGCQVALITATAVINGTMDDILASAESCREVCILGASAPLSPGVYRGTPVTVVSGVLATDPGKVLQVVSEGGGMQIFKHHVRKVNLRIK